jgi:hypothetical protein
MRAPEPLHVSAAFSHLILIRLMKFLFVPSFTMALFAVICGKAFMSNTMVSLASFGTILVLAAILPTNRTCEDEEFFFDCKACCLRGTDDAQHAAKTAFKR